MPRNEITTKKIIKWLIKHKKITVSWFAVSIVFLCINFLIIGSLIIIYLEAKNSKPLFGNEHTNDCRIVNNIASMQENKELRIYTNINSNLAHVIALNEDGTVLDKSNTETKNNNNEKIKTFDESCSIIKDFTFKDGIATIHNHSFSAYGYIYYFYMFRIFYSLTH